MEPDWKVFEMLDDAVSAFLPSIWPMEMRRAFLLTLPISGPLWMVLSLPLLTVWFLTLVTMDCSRALSQLWKD